jgi:hypothetical protein
LAVDQSIRRTGLACLSDPAAAGQRIQDSLPHPALVPPLKALVDHPPRREVPRQIAPVAAGFRDIKNRVYDQVDIVLRTLPSRIGTIKEGLDLLPLLILDVAWITPPLSAPFSGSIILDIKY